MKKMYALCSIVIVFLTSCQKNDAYLSEEDSKNYYAKGFLENKPLAEINACSIVQLTYSLGSENDNLQFTYNSVGDPVSITRTLGAHTGRPNYMFKYDDKNRLTDFIGHYNNSSAEFWHKYSYDNKGNIVLDSAYIFPQISRGIPENAYMRQLTFYTYDNKQRIIRDSTVFSSSSIPPVVNTYAYDASGNKTGSTYDDQININRTNRIWMFINRDYSVNNPYQATSYNTTGLPQSINLSSEGKAFTFLKSGFYKADILYQCNSKTSKDLPGN